MGRLRIFEKWYQHASVRTMPWRQLQVDAPLGFYSARVAPVLRHPLVCDLPFHQRRSIEVQLLYGYLRFTEHLETSLVNPVILDIVNGTYALPFGDELKAHAYKIYCDEAFHALQAHDMQDQVRTLSGEEPLDLPVPLQKRLRALREDHPPSTHPLFDLYFVCVAETLVSRELSEQVLDPTVHASIHDLMRDHARDEVAHAMFFAEVLHGLRKELPPPVHAAYIDLVPAMLNAYLLPDRRNLGVLLSAHLPAAKVEVVLNDILAPEPVQAMIDRASEGLWRTIRNVKNEEAG